MYQRFRERFAALPGVISVSAVNHLPIAGDVWTLGYTIEGRPAPPAGDRWSAIYRVVDPGYFATIGLPLVDGRDFSDADRAGAMPVAIVNRSHGRAAVAWREPDRPAPPPARTRESGGTLDDRRGGRQRASAGLDRGAG